MHSLRTSGFELLTSTQRAACQQSVCRRRHADSLATVSAAAMRPSLSQLSRKEAVSMVHGDTQLWAAA